MKAYDKAKEIKQKVLSFYDELPFNYYGNVEEHIKKIKSDNKILLYRDLHKILKKPRIMLPLIKLNRKIKTVLEIGCGAGWFANSVAYHYDVKVKALDMTEKAVERAKAVADRLNLSELIEYSVADLFSYEDKERYDLVSSLGVLHHSTHDCKEAFLYISKFVKPSKYIYIGLYHLYGRKVFLEYLRTHYEKHGEDSAFRLFMELNPQITDSTYGKSWFRDQVMHPHETSHTLQEVVEWLKIAGFQLLNTSINKFQHFNNIEDLISLEKTFSDVSYQRNVVEKKFYPGFFTVMGKKLEA